MSTTIPIIRSELADVIVVSKRPRERRGTALVLVLIAVVVLAVLSTGAILGSMQELRAAHNEQMAQRALTAAEYGLNQQLSNWTTARNMMANGAIESSTVAIAAGDTAAVKIMRLNNRTFWIVSVGRTNRSSGRLEAQRQVNLLVDLTNAAPKVPAVITSKDNLRISGNSTVTGLSTPPPSWSGCPTEPDTFAIAINPSKSLSVQKPATQAVNGTNADPNAALSSTYLSYPPETFATLMAKAAITTLGNPTPTPAGSATTCTYGPNNWGEPFVGAGAVVGCQSYFPIIYSPGNLKLSSSGRGQGILLVDGDLDVSGGIIFVGLIVVRGKFKASGGFTLYGALLAEGDFDATSSGSSSYFYSPCALSRAFENYRVPARTKKRSWAQLYQ